jgi:SAM-dependent methyltransferase
MTTARETVRVAFDRLPAGMRDTIRGRFATVRGLDQLKRNQAMLAVRLAALEHGTASGGAADRPVVADDRFAGLTSRICTQAQFDEPWFTARCAALGEEVRWRRKLWEHAYIAHALDTLGTVGDGQRGLGFGVGREAMVAYLAGKGCTIVATDLDAGEREARAWTETDQHAAGELAALARGDLCPAGEFAARVTWLPVDMRAIPAELTGFDFCWSACSLEHLGTLDAGLAFIERSLATLRPGGIAVHTTEFNLSSDDRTPMEGPTVLFRRRDMVDLAARLEAAGHEVAAFDLDPGSGVLDEFVDLPPFLDEPLLRLAFREFTTTSIALVIRAGR